MKVKESKFCKGVIEVITTVMNGLAQSLTGPPCFLFLAISHYMFLIGFK